MNLKQLMEDVEQVQCASSRVETAFNKDVKLTSQLQLCDSIMTILAKISNNLLDSMSQELRLF